MVMVYMVFLWKSARSRLTTPEPATALSPRVLGRTNPDPAYGPVALEKILPATTNNNNKKKKCSILNNNPVNNNVLFTDRQITNN